MNVVYFEMNNKKQVKWQLKTSLIIKERLPLDRKEPRGKEGIKEELDLHLHQDETDTQKEN